MVDVPESGIAPFLYAAAIMALVAVVASAIPAWRAARMSPLTAIRNRI